MQSSVLGQAVLDFQRNFVRDSTQKIDKYFELIGRKASLDRLRAPEWLVPPYFFDRQIGGADYGVSLEMAKIAATGARGDRLRPVACFLDSALSGANVSRVVDDYAPFGHVISFPSRFDETKASVNELQGFWNLTIRLSGRGCRPLMLYGGYFSVLGHHAGLDGLSHGVGYGESRDALSPSSGPPGPRYYIPALHRFFPVDQAQALLQLDRNARELLRCDCESCVLARAANRGSLAQRTREDIFVHFLRARHAEIADVQRRPLADLVQELRTMHTYAVGLAPAMANDFAFLAKWADAIDPPARA